MAPNPGGDTPKSIRGPFQIEKVKTTESALNAELDALAGAIRSKKRETTCHAPERWYNADTGTCEHTDHDAQQVTA